MFPRRPSIWSIFLSLDAQGVLVHAAAWLEESTMQQPVAALLQQGQDGTRAGGYGLLGGDQDSGSGLLGPLSRAGGSTRALRDPAVGAGPVFVAADLQQHQPSNKPRL